MCMLQNAPKCIHMRRHMYTNPKMRVMYKNAVSHDGMHMNERNVYAENASKCKVMTCNEVCANVRICIEMCSGKNGTHSGKKRHVTPPRGVLVQHRRGMTHSTGVRLIRACVMRLLPCLARYPRLTRLGPAVGMDTERVSECRR